MTEQATLKFGLRGQAKDFCTAWAFFSKRGHLLGAGKENVTVILFDVTEYTEGVSDTQRYKMLGNGWTVDVIAHLFKHMNPAAQ